MNKFNLAEWALKKRQLVYFFIVVIFTMGLFSYLQMGRSEDPDFVIRQMVIATAWPGATEPEVEDQVTYKIERKPGNFGVSTISWGPAPLPII